MKVKTKYHNSFSILKCIFLLQFHTDLLCTFGFIGLKYVPKEVKIFPTIHEINFSAIVGKQL